MNRVLDNSNVFSESIIEITLFKIINTYTQYFYYMKYSLI